MVRSVGKAIGKVNDVLEVFTGYAIFVFMLLLFLQVVMRFVFKRPIYGIDEAVVALMIWSMCLGWCTVYWDNGHAVLEFIMNRMPGGFRRVIFTLTNFLVVVISWVYILAAIPDAEENAACGRASLQQGILLRAACSGNECGNVDYVSI